METVYYTITVFVDPNKPGKGIKNQYKKYENAIKKVKSMIASDNNISVMIHKETYYYKQLSSVAPFIYYLKPENTFYYYYLYNPYSDGINKTGIISNL